MNTKVAVGLIVLTAVVTYELSHHRRHHFEPTKLGDGSILLDTETGVECSARFAMKWTDANKKAVWAAGLAAKKAEAKYSAGYSPPPPLPPRPIFDLSTAQPPLPHDARFDLMTAEYNYNQLVEKADNEKVPDPNSSYFQSFPLCKNIR
jgi:hypothetical protein